MRILTQQSTDGSRVFDAPVPSSFQRDVENVMILSHPADLQSEWIGEFEEAKRAVNSLEWVRSNEEFFLRFVKSLSGLNWNLIS